MPAIAHVTPHYPPFLGGLERVVYALVGAQVAQGEEVEVFTSGGRSPVGLDNDGTIVHRLRSFEVAHTALMPSLPGSLSRLSAGTVIHVHVAQAFVPEVVYLTHLRHKVPYVAHLHIDVGPSGPAGWLLKLYKPYILKHVLRAAASVVVFTEEQRVAISRKYGIDEERIHVIPNGVDEGFFFEGPREIHDPPRLLFVGRLAIQKNLPLLLHALEGISDRFETTLVGVGELEQELREMAERLHLRNVRFHGRADGDELLSLYRRSDVFVLPSEREGMPLVLLEAMAMGLPVVATDIAGTRDVVEHDETGILVDPNDPSSMRQALLDVIRDGQRYENMSVAARKRVEGRSWTAVADRFARLYASATDAGRSNS